MTRSCGVCVPFVFFAALAGTAQLSQLVFSCTRDGCFSAMQYNARLVSLLWHWWPYSTGP